MSMTIKTIGDAKRADEEDAIAPAWTSASTREASGSWNPTTQAMRRREAQSPDGAS